MKHVIIGSGWSFGSEPFPAFRLSMSYGRNQNDREFIGVNGIVPDGNGVLQENAFKVIKTKEGAILIVAGEDTTPRCLLFVGSSGGFRGGVEVFAEATTGRVLKNCSASNACESGMEIAALLDLGQSVAFYSTGRRTDQVEVYTWNGTEVESKTWSRMAWDRRNDPERSEDNITWIPGNFRIVQLRGNDVSDGVILENGRLTRSVFDGEGRLAHGFNVPKEGSFELQTARFGRDMHEELVIAPTKVGEIVDKDRYVVLVHEYSPGSGSKRWPSFSVDWDNAGQVEKIGSVYRGKGSGSDSYTLIIAPVGWAENIAAQFINERDYNSQTISYKPDFSPSKKESDIPSELLIAFRDDEERARQFMSKVEALPVDRIDAHIVQNCGRARVKAHLEEISGDPEFFMGADPNRVVFYVSQVHLSKESDSRQDSIIPSSSSGSFGSLADALKKAGLSR